MRVAPGILTVVGMAALFAVGEARSDDSRGFFIARQWCSGCHSISSSQSSPKLEAPTFRAIADEPSTTEYALRIFLRTPHPTMPNFVLEPLDITDLASYIASLKSKR